MDCGVMRGVSGWDEGVGKSHPKSEEDAEKKERGEMWLKSCHDPPLRAVNDAALRSG